MTTTGNFFMDLLVWINIYGIYLAIAFVPSVYYIWLKIFSFPLITRRAHELLLILGPEKVTIKKIKTRWYSMFNYKKGLYWFGKPFNDIESSNQFHVYIEGINQPLSDLDNNGQLKRRGNKVDDLTTSTDRLKEITGHSVKIPRNIKDHMHRHWQVILEPKSLTLQIRPVEKRQSLKFSFYHSIGFVIGTPTEEQIEIEEETGASTTKQKLLLTDVTTQVILDKIKYIQDYKNYSSYFSYSLIKKIRRANANFPRWIIGGIDPRILLILIFIFGGIALVYFGMPLLTPDIGEMPTN